MARSTAPTFVAPVFLGAAFFVFGLAMIEKALNIVGGTIPVVSVFPRQLLDWAVVLLMFEIALSVRLGYERLLRQGDPNEG